MEEGITLFDTCQCDSIVFHSFCAYNVVHSQKENCNNKNGEF